LFKHFKPNVGEVTVKSFDNSYSDSKVWTSESGFVLFHVHGFESQM
jgi:hypothetical protein